MTNFGLCLALAAPENELTPATSPFWML